MASLRLSHYSNPLPEAPARIAESRLSQQSTGGALWPPAIVFLLVISVQSASSWLGLIAAILAAAWGLSSPKNAIYSLTLSWLMGQLNPGVAAPHQAFAIARWLTLCCAFVGVVSYFLARRRAVPRVVISLLLLIAVSAASSFLNSAFIDVSLLKLAAFGMGSLTILLAFHATRDKQELWSDWFTALFVVVVLVSLPLAMTPTGYLRNASGFQGILNHPQAYGVFLSPMLLWIGTRLFLKEERRRVVHWSFWVGLASAFLTQSRTAILSMVAAAAVGLFFSAAFRPRWRREIAQGLARPRRVVIVFLALAGVVLGAPFLQSSFQAFLLKGQSAGSVTESLSGSRGFLIQRSLENFRRHPVFGIGFGVPSDPDGFEITRDPFLGLPVGAAVEKGVLPVAALEEIGVVGVLMLGMLLLSLLKPATRAASPVALFLSLAALAVNLGEAVLFSLGGLGLFVWLLLGLSRLPE